MSGSVETLLYVVFGSLTAFGILYAIIGMAVSTAIRKEIRPYLRIITEYYKDKTGDGEQEEAYTEPVKEKWSGSLWR